jgi:hypothetical protein
MLRSPMTRALFIALGLAAAGCNQPTETARATQAIFEGAPDEGHQAVVVYVAETGGCSAVIFEVHDDTGYALTAAHCAGGAPGVLRQGPDPDQPEVEYQVVESVPHPLALLAGPFDVAVLRFVGADAATPFIPLSAPGSDALTEGDLVELVGYGLTEEGPSHTRRSVTLPVWEADLTRMLFDQQTGGFCSGDSGGPALSGSPPRVVALLQSVTPDCRGIGMAGRVSAFHTSFIEPVMAGTVPEAPSCAACVEAASFSGSVCAAAAERCAGDAQCTAFAACSEGCRFDACRADCRAAHPAGALLHAPLEHCLCDTCAACACGGQGSSPAAAPVDAGEPEASGCSVAGRDPPRVFALLALVVPAALTLRRRRGTLSAA